jgi:hypothetical protein
MEKFIMFKDTGKVISKETKAICDYLLSSPPPSIEYVAHSSTFFELYIQVNGVEVYVAYRKDFNGNPNLYKMTIGNYINLIEPHEKQVIAQMLLFIYNSHEGRRKKREYDEAKTLVRKQLLGET